VNQSARHGVADVLRDVRGSGSFSTRLTAPTDGLSIKVRDVGVLRSPVTAAQAKALRLVARPARYGNGEETLLDRRVRDTWEVPRSRVTIDNRRWASTLRPILDQVRDDLGLPATCSLAADLHSMFVYEPGQFFAAHQDSEKHDRMVGSLVVLLPSRSTGGDLVVSHQGTTVTHRGSATALTFIAFYSDTRHEVLPVESGYRVALTYNLRLDGDSVTSEVAGSAPPAAVVALVRQHFATAAEPRWRGDNEAGETPGRLVFLLDHQYSEHSLRWELLKGEDATRARMLRDAAALADCEVALAHAEVHETWDIDYDYGPRRGWREWSSWDDGPDPDDTDALRICSTRASRSDPPKASRLAGVRWPTQNSPRRRRASSWNRTTPSTRATWGTTATRWTAGTGEPRSWSGRSPTRSRCAPRETQPAPSTNSLPSPTATR
jgi:hypothetical protein